MQRVGFQRNVVETAVGQGRFTCRLQVIDWSHLDEPEALLVWLFPGPDRRYNPGSARVPMARIGDLRAGAVAAWDRLQQASAAAGDLNVSTMFDSHGYRWALRAGPSQSMQPLPGNTHSSHIAIRSAADLEAFTTALTQAEEALPRLLAIV